MVDGGGHIRQMRSDVDREEVKVQLFRLIKCHDEKPSTEASLFRNSLIE